MSIHKELNNLRNRIKQYELKPDHSDTYLIWMRQLEQAILEHLEQSDMDQQQLLHKHTKTTDQLYEIIKKQALIIEAAGIQFPTINQPLQLIYDTYLASKKQFDQIPTKLAPHQIQVTIGTI